jgi:hypothetical protein
MNETTDAVDAPSKTPSIWEDLVDIYFSPREVFERRKFGGFGLALLALTLILAVLAIPTQLSIAGLMQDTLRESMATAGQAEPSSEQLANMGRFTMAIGVAGTLVIVPIGALLSGLVLTGLGVLAGVTLPVRAAILVTVWSGFPRVWAMVTMMLEASFFNAARITDLSLGPARMLGADASPLLVGVLSRLDIFTIWAMVLVVIGVIVVGGASRGRAVAMAAGLWVAGCIPAVLGGLFAGPPGG